MNGAPGEITAAEPAEEKVLWRVILAASVGTLFEWYDFYLYGSLAGIIAKQFFSGLDPTSAFIFALLASRRVSSCVRSAPWCSAAWAT